MGIGKLLLSIIIKFRDFVQDKIMKGINKLKHPQTKKFLNVSPTSLPKIIAYVGFFLFIGVVLIRAFTNVDTVSGGDEAYERELTNSTANIRSEGRFPVQDDLSKALTQFTDNNKVADPLSDINMGSVTNVAECFDLLDKMKRNEKFNEQESEKFKECLTTQDLGLTEEQKKFAEKFTDPTLSDAERAILAKAASGEASETELALAQALSSGDPNLEKIAKSAIASGDPELMDLVAKQVRGEELTEDEKKRLADMGSASSGVSGLANAVSATGSDSSEKGLNDLTQKVADRELEIQRKEQELTSDQIRASEAAKKVQSGLDLSNDDIQKLQRLAKSKEDLNALKKIQDKEKEELAKRWVRLQKTLAQTSATIGRVLPTGVFLEYEGEEVNCKTIKPLPIKRKVKQKPVFVDFDNRPLKPEEVEFIKIMRKGQVAEAKPDDFKSDLGRPLQVATGGENQALDVSSLFFHKDQGIRGFELSPDMKIPAQLESEILVAEGGSMPVRIRILEDIHDPQTNELLFPKGSISVANAGSFDGETGIMNLIVDKITTGGKTTTVRLTVGSGNGQIGLRGEVYDPTGKLLLGAFIPAFAGGALGWFSQQVTEPFASSTDGGEAITGAALAGSGEVMNRIAEIMSSRLQNAKKVFYVPSGVPLVLFPSN